jgi:ribose-phosphate pyrophosphokinase
MLVLGFPDCMAMATAIATELGAPCAAVEIHAFPDGESRVRLPVDLPHQVVLCRSLDHPNDKLVELLLTARCARELGVRQLTLIAPYLCYMRQDAAFQPGEAVSQRIVGDFLASMVDTLVSADPHLHRVQTLAEAVPARRAVAVSAAPLMGAFLAGRDPAQLLVGPDSESEQWVTEVARLAGLEFAVAQKTRRGDRSVDIRLPARDFAGRATVLVDDVASSGRTLAVAARALREAGASRVDVLVTHALFAGDAMATLLDAGVDEVWSSDSISHPSNRFSLAPALAAAVG